MLRKLLIVEDVAINRIMLRKMLSADYEVLEAENGEDALRIMRQYVQSLDAILLDIVMPGINGFDVLEQMQGDPLLSQIPVIVVTAEKDVETEIRSLSLGAIDLVTKPYDPIVLSHRVKNVIHLRETAAMRNTLEKDDLTGIYHRRAFFSIANNMIQAKEPGYYVMACFDVDKFKVINDQYGNAKGDEVLQSIAHIFECGFTAIGGICGRITADDFAVLYPRSYMHSDVLADIRKKTSLLDGKLPPLSFSIGRYIIDDKELPVSGMYDRALLAQSAAKGKFEDNIVLYDESMRENLLREQRITSEMENALEAEQFEVWLQPQYNHATQALIGAEALVRWRHPERGIVPPGVFIPVFERNGFIFELDKYVWERSCILLRRWIDAGYALLPISVNISRYDVLREDFFMILTGLVEKYQLPVELLRIEITETAFAEEADHIVNIVKKLIAFGFTVEIDDFGSGYSSLNTLKDVPAQVLKLDMRFLENNEDSDRGGNVVESVVRMAKWLGMAVIAEGVETIKQADYLKSIGCTYIQGYLYAKPMPVAEYEALFQNAGKEEKLLAMETVKNLDNNAFWNSNSIDTLIFNSYVGAATILEYHNGNVELLRVSDKFVQMLNSKTMSFEDTLKLDWTKLFGGDSLQRFSEGIERSIQTGDESIAECVFVGVPGCAKEIHLRITFRVIASAGTRYLVYCLNENISIQKALESKERASNEQLQAIMDNINGGVSMSVIRNGTPEIRFANEKFYSLMGYTKEQLEAEVEDPRTIIHEEDRDNVFGITGSIQKPTSLVYRIIRRDGAVRWLLNNITIVRLPDINEPVHLSVTNDITEMREAEEKERASSEQLQAIMDNINGGVTATIIRDGVPHLLFANDRFYSQYGYTKEQFEAEVKNPHKLLHPDDYERVAWETLEGSRTNQPFSTVCRVIRRDKSICWLQTSVTIMTLPGIDEPVQLAVAADITLQKELEEKEHMSAQQLQAIMDNINGGVSLAVMQDGFPKVISANEQFYAQRGYTKEEYEAISIKPSNIFHPDDIEKISNIAKTAQGAHSAIYRIIQRDGTVRWMQNNITEVMLPGYDEPVRLSVSNDITELREAERKEHDVSERLNAIMKALNSGISGVTLSGNATMRYVFANDMYYSMLGFTREQFEAEVGNGLNLIHPDDKARIDAEFAAHLRSRNSAIFEYRTKRRDGDIIYMRTNSSILMLDGIDEPVSVGVSNDVTDMVKAQQKITALSERLQAVLDNVDSGITATEIHGAHVGYLFCNDRFYEINGYTKAQYEAEVSDIYTLIHPEDRQTVSKAVAKVNKAGRNKTLEYRIVRRDGTERWIRTAISVRNMPDMPNPVQFAVYTDITEEKLARVKLRASNEQLQFLNDTAGELLAQTDAVGSINRVLGMIRKGFGSDRAFIFEYKNDETICSFSYEDCAPGVSACRELYQRFPISTAWYWQKSFQSEPFIRISDINELGQDRLAEREILQTLGVTSALAVALRYGGNIIGTLGVFNPTLHLDDYENLRALADYIAIILIRRDLQLKIANDRDMLQTMMNDMPGGFTRLRVLADGSLISEYVNETACRMRGLTQEEALSAEYRITKNVIHPQDWAMVSQNIQEMVATDEPRNIKYRLKHKNGTYIPFSVFGRATVDEKGTKYINLYYTHVSEQEIKEQTIRETVPLILTAMLSTSTNLAFAKDLDFRYICASAEMVKITQFTHERDIIGKTDYEIFPKEIADILRSNDQKLLEADRPLLDYIQALPFADGSLHYYEMSKYILRDTYGNTLGVYAIGRDVTEERGAYARLKLLVDSIPGGIATYIASPHGIRISYFNDGFCNMFGYTHEEYEKISSTGITNITFAEDVPAVMEHVQALLDHDVPLECTYRVHTKDGGYKWVNLKGGIAERHGDIVFLNTVLYDVTERVEAADALRLSEEEFRIAAAVGGRSVAHYDIKTGAYRHQSAFLTEKGFDTKVEQVPQAFIDAGLIAPECIPEYLDFYDKLRNGESPCSVDIAVIGENDEWRWLRESATVLTDADGMPARAVIVLSDITELREKETVFIKWQQTLHQKPEEIYMLFRCNLSKNGSFETAEGKLFWIPFAPGIYSFDERTREYAGQCVYPEDRENYIAFMRADVLLADYYAGKHTKVLAYRELLPDGTIRWLRLTVELVEYPNSDDVEAFLLYEDINESKRDELRTRELAETDPLTGVLNRAAFAQDFLRIVSEPTFTGGIALLMLDIDNFKRINDTLGHAMGDQVLKDTADTLRSIIRQGDLLCRLGGDEFIICLRDIYDDGVIKEKAAQICSLLHKSLNLDLQTSVSIGVAVCPRNGYDFETLYQKADAALYHVKANGKNNYAFFQESMMPA